MTEKVPVSVQADVEQSPTVDQPLIVRIRMTVDEKYHIYSGEDNFFALDIAASEGLLQPRFELPDTKMIPDTFADNPLAEASVFKDDPVFRIIAQPDGNDGTRWRISGKLSYQGCSDVLCLPPAEFAFDFSGKVGRQDTTDDSGSTETAGTTQTGDWLQLAEGFKETSRTVGYQGTAKFAEFLDKGLGMGGGGGSVFDSLGERSGLVLLLIILVGGLALNLTPCVLPMIPINLAIIGAGAQAGSKKRGFLLGATYGGAIAAVYGILGLVVVLTGSTFGSLNASPWFNLAISVVFIVLALAMVGVFEIDLSRLGTGLDTSKFSKGSFPLAAFMGGVAALLAGACVAPVVIAVLLLAAQQYAEGNPLGLAYPFLLGIGMGLPWAFAGGGLSFLPKPGGWMTKVKYLFGAFVFLMGLYYGYLGIKLLAGPGSRQETTLAGNWHDQLLPALSEAKKTGKPLFIDFWATWCKNCHAMEKTTLKDEEITAKLEQFVLLKFQADDPRDPAVKPVMDYFAVQGLPTYIVVAPE